MPEVSLESVVSKIAQQYMLVATPDIVSMPSVSEIAVENKRSGESYYLHISRQQDDSIFVIVQGLVRGYLGISAVVAKGFCRHANGSNTELEDHILWEYM